MKKHSNGKEIRFILDVIYFLESIIVTIFLIAMSKNSTYFCVKGKVNHYLKVRNRKKGGVSDSSTFGNNSKKTFFTI